MFRKLAGLFSSPTPKKVQLTRVYSEKKRRELYKILHHPNPRHNQRLWLAGFLKFAGYQFEEVEKIIALENSWTNYRPKKTHEQLSSVFHIYAPRSEEGGAYGGNRRRRLPTYGHPSSRQPQTSYSPAEPPSVDPLPSVDSLPSRLAPPSGPVPAQLQLSGPRPRSGASRRPRGRRRARRQDYDPPSRQPSGWERLCGMEERNGLGSLNLELLDGALNIVSEYTGEDGLSRFSYGKEPELRPWDVPLYRTIEGEGHCLAVVDIDCENDLGRAWRVMRRLMDVHDFRWAKFSGNKGFHGIDILPGADRDGARRHVEAICSGVDMEGLSPDPRMFCTRQLVRAFAINWKTMHQSIPVRRDKSLDDILRQSMKWCGT